MTIKKFVVIVAAGALLLAGAIGISMRLTQPQAMELAVDAAEEDAGDLPKTLENMENMPLYYNDRDMLLLPLRNVMEGLGGTVAWNTEKHMTEISYRGKKLLLEPDTREAMLNGYEITLPVAAEMINGCLYAEEVLLTTYYTGDVVWDTDSEQIILQAKDHTIPIVAEKILTATQNGKSYHIELPVIVGLNDTNFEKSLNEGIRKELLEQGEAFLAEQTEAAEGEEAAEDAAELTLNLHTGWISEEFISLWWEGTQGEETIYLTKNIDLVGQKIVNPQDLLKKNTLQQLREMGGEDAEPLFYMGGDGTAVLLYWDAEGYPQEYRWEKEQAPVEWKKAYRGIFDMGE